jgi:hypothetical protein
MLEVTRKRSSPATGAYDGPERQYKNPCVELGKDINVPFSFLKPKATERVFWSMETGILAAKHPLKSKKSEELSFAGFSV